ncbi:unnamed protein product [Gongylonema pulchrum]|uniref:Uncharacterized protein n=1 Tax=Gongylonema pulchrum TaxID=637853 RepID=A0A183D228_9BILA|nr:unnamed protein product [Gongylonema pulchrum]
MSILQKAAPAQQITEGRVEECCREVTDPKINATSIPTQTAEQYCSELLDPSISPGNSATTEAAVKAERLQELKPPEQSLESSKSSSRISSAGKHAGSRMIRSCYYNTDCEVVGYISGAQDEKLVDLTEELHEQEEPSADRRNLPQTQEGDEGQKSVVRRRRSVAAISVGKFLRGIRLKTEVLCRI